VIGFGQFSLLAARSFALRSSMTLPDLGFHRCA
jgi:hypothetical protein